MADDESTRESSDQSGSGDSNRSSGDSAKKSGTKTTKKAASKKTASAKKPAPRPREEESSSSEDDSSSRSSQSGGSARSAGTGSSAKKPGAMKVARAAVEQLTQLTGRAPECVVGVERLDDGWEVSIEVVESRRIPDSTDILATYRVQCDDDGELTGYQRASRYVRGKGDERG